MSSAPTCSAARSADLSAQAIAELLAASPAPPDVIAGWDARPRAAAHQGAAGGFYIDEQLYRSLFGDGGR